MKAKIIILTLMLFNAVLKPYQFLDIPCLIVNADQKQSLYVNPNTKISSVFDQHLQ